MRLLILTLCSLSACTWLGEARLEQREQELRDRDGDGDGVPDRLDCAPEDPAASVSALVFRDADGDGLGDASEFAEQCGGPFEGWSLASGDLCDEVAGLIAPEPFFRDADGDGQGAGTPELFCALRTNPPAGWVAEDGDCDDDDDGLSGEGLAYWQDADLDTYGGGAVQQMFCAHTPPAGWSALSTDCDDADPAVNPGAQEVCGPIDEDCDGLTDNDPDLGPAIPYAPDEDDDGVPSADITLTACPEPGWVAFTGLTDCDDDDPTIAPGVPEVCDGIDNNCNGTVDEAQEFEVYYRDADLDGWPSGLTFQACVPPPDGIRVSSVPDLDAVLDCDDADPTIFPGAQEIHYDGVDRDCDPSNDDDQDGDGFLAVSAGGADCDDTDAAIHPLAVEVYYDGVDQDCDPSNDDDRDGDGFAWDQRGGADCDDDDASVNPLADEVYYDGIDQDCDASTPDGDQDRDGFLAAEVGGPDCDDTDATVFPGAFEVPDDGVDQNCDGETGALCFLDLDQDGFGRGQVLVLSSGCTGVYVAVGEDCDDGDETVYPGAVERCDGRLNDCTGPGEAGTASAFERDTDVVLDLTPMLGGVIALDPAEPLLVNLCPPEAGPLEVAFHATDGNTTIRALGGSGVVRPPSGAPFLRVDGEETQVAVEALTVEAVGGRVLVATDGRVTFVNLKAGGGPGPMLQVDGSTVDLDGVTLAGAVSEVLEGTGGAQVSMSRVTAAGSFTPRFYVDEASLISIGSSQFDGRAFEIVAEEALVVLTDVTIGSAGLEDAIATVSDGALIVSGATLSQITGEVPLFSATNSTVIVTSSSLKGNELPLTAALEIDGGLARLTDVDARENLTRSGIVSAVGASVSLIRGGYRTNRAVEDGGVVSAGPGVTLYTERVGLDDNRARRGGAIFVDTTTALAPTTVDFQTTYLLGNRAEIGGDTVWFAGNGSVGIAASDLNEQSGALTQLATGHLFLAASAPGSLALSLRDSTLRQESGVPLVDLFGAHAEATSGSVLARGTTARVDDDATLSFAGQTLTLTNGTRFEGSRRSCTWTASPLPTVMGPQVTCVGGECACE